MTHPLEVIPEIMAGAGPFDVAGDVYLDVPNGAPVATNASTPHHASLAIVGDIDIAVELTMDDWSPPTARWLVTKYGSAGSRAFLFSINPSGALAFQWSVDGTNVIGHTSTVTLSPFPARRAVRVTLDVDNGAGGRVVTFYEAASIAGPWTTVSTATTSGTTSIFNASSQVLEVGNALAGNSTGLGGRVHKLEVRSSIGGTVVANPDFTAQSTGATSFADSTGKTWTVSAGASIAGFDWEPIPDEGNGRKRLKQLTWDVGRDDPLSWFPPGTGEATFRSNDRLLDPEYTAGQFFGQLLPRVPLRFRSVGPDADLFYGFPESGWQQVYEKPYASRSTVRMRDLLGVIQDMRLPLSAYVAEVTGDNPAAYWRLDEASGNQMADSSGNGRHGFYDNGILGQDPLVFGDGHSAEFPHVGDNRGQWSGEGLPVSAPCTLEAWVKTGRDAAAIKTIIAAQRDYSLGSALALQIHTSASGSPNGELVIDFFGLGSFYKARGHARIDDGQPHHVVCVIASPGTSPSDITLYVDGEVQTKTTVSGTNPGTWTSHLIWTVGNTADNGQGDYGFDGLVDEAAIYAYALTADQVLAHYEAGTTAFDGDTSGERLDRVLDLVGVPPELRDIDLGDTTVGPADYGGQTAGSYLNRVVESEQGYLYVDHPGGGKLTFRGRYHRLTETRSTTSQATFTDDPDALGAWHYRDEIVPEPNSIDTVVNTVEVSWRGGTEVVSDEGSIVANGPRSRTITTEAPTPASARSSGLWVIARYSEPQSRITSLPLTPGGGQVGLDAVVVGQRISDRITVRRRPVNVGAPIVNELIVEGIRNEMHDDGSWLATYRTSNADDTQVWIWGASTWDETTTWG